MAYLVCTCRRLGGTCWWVDRGPVQTLDWRQGCDRNVDPDTLRELSAKAGKTCWPLSPAVWVTHLSFFGGQSALLKQRPSSHSSHCGFIYLDSDWWRACCVLLHSCVCTCRGAQMLIRNTSSIESWKDGHRRPGGTLNDERASLTRMSRVVLQNGVKIN